MHVQSTKAKAHRVKPWGQVFKHMFILLLLIPNRIKMTIMPMMTVTTVIIIIRQFYHCHKLKEVATDIPPVQTPAEDLDFHLQASHLVLQLSVAVLAFSCLLHIQVAMTIFTQRADMQNHTLLQNKNTTMLPTYCLTSHNRTLCTSVFIYWLQAQCGKLIMSMQKFTLSVRHIV